jgi:hypothetical protein
MPSSLWHWLQPVCPSCGCVQCESATLECRRRAGEGRRAVAETTEGEQWRVWCAPVFLFECERMLVWQSLVEGGCVGARRACDAGGCCCACGAAAPRRRQHTQRVKLR